MYRNAARRRPSHSYGQHAEKIDEVCSCRSCGMFSDRQTDRQTVLSQYVTLLPAAG